MVLVCNNQLKAAQEKGTFLPFLNKVNGSGRFDLKARCALWDVHWAGGYRGSLIEHSKLEPLPGSLPGLLRCGLGKEGFFSQYLSPHRIHVLGEGLNL